MMNIFPFVILFFIMAIIASFNIWDIKLNYRSRIILFIIVGSIFILLAGLRWYDVPLINVFGQGRIFDYSTYEKVYNNPISNGFSFFSEYFDLSSGQAGMELGYSYVSSFFSNYIISDFNVFLLLFSFVTVCVFFKSLQRNRITYIFFFVIFIYFSRLYIQYNFISMRQALAMAICWWAIPFIIQHEFKKFVLFCIIGGLFHFSAFVFIIAYWLPEFKFSNKLLKWLLPICLLFGFAGVFDKILLLLIEFMLKSLGFSYHLLSYIRAEVFTQRLNPINFLEVLPFVYIAIRYRDDITKTAEGKLFFNMLVFYTIFLSITMNFSFLTRVSTYFIYSYFFIINYFFEKTDCINNKLIIGNLLLFYFFVYSIRHILTTSCAEYGYHIFFLQ